MQWLPKHDAAMEEMRQLVTVTTMPVLRYYDISMPVTIQNDSSQNGQKCCLMREGQPVVYASRALTLMEKNYAKIKKEYLSMVFACQRFHHYLCGREVITAEMDHKLLTAIF